MMKKKRSSEHVRTSRLFDTSQMRHWLAGDDIERVQALAATHRQRETATGRALLRRAAVEFNVPVDATIGTGPHGKPMFVHYPQVHFNLSHADELVVLAISDAQEVGIDVERSERKLNSRALAKRNCHPHELLALEGFSDEEHRQEFLRMWVCKEAVLKARGDGVHGGPSNVECMFANAQARYANGSEAIVDWHLTEWVTEEHRIAVATAHSANFEMTDLSDSW